MWKRLPLIVLLAWPAWHDAAAQFATVSGEIVDAESKQALTGAHVHLRTETEARGTTTNGQGRFAFSGVEPGSHELVVSHVGFAEWTDTIDVAFGESVRVLIRLEPTAETLDEVLVDAESEQPVDAEGVGHIRVQPAALQNVPMPDVSADLAAFLLTRPGIVTPGDRGGQLFVRGGTPTQNLVLIDGMQVYRPFHIVGFYSVFPADIVAYADVYAGGFGAEYGGRLSSVIDVTTRNGSKEKFSGAASIAPFLASVRAEVPLVPENVSLLVSVRESVIERLSPTLINATLPYRFGDRFVKMHAFLNRTSSVSATFLHSFDEGDVAAVEGEENASQWTNTTVGGRYFYLPEDVPTTTSFAAYSTRYTSTYVPDEGERRRSDVQSFDLKLRFSYFLTNLEVAAGLSGSTYWLEYDLGGPRSLERQNFTEGGFFVAGDWDTEHFQLSPGVRLQAYSHGTGTVLEPRLRAEWRPGRQTFSAAWGIYHQQFIGLNNQRDVTDSFTAWAASPSNAPVPRSVHYLAGTSRRLLPFLTVGVEGYVRRIENSLFPFLEEGLGSDPVRERVDGSARGLDVSVELHRPWLYIYAGYGLSLVEYADLQGGAGSREKSAGSFSPPHDRRHNVNLLARISVGSFCVNARWQYGSGIPFTPVQAYHYAAVPQQPGDRDFLTHEGTVQTQFGPPYSRRLPAYHRLDVTAERDFRFQGWRLVAHVGVINAYDRANIFSYDVQRDRRIDQLPLIPSAGVRVEIDG